MEYTLLSKNVILKTISEDDNVGTFELSGLYTGYGVTIGNAIRRVLLSSLPGAAITRVKIKGAKHEFATIDNILEDVVDITLNLKKVRFEFFADEPQTVTIVKKGAGKVTAGDIKCNSQLKVVNPSAHIATVTSKNGEINMEITVERGLGYSPVNTRKGEKSPIGTIAIDAIFTPVVNVDFTVENMRVGDRTDYNKLALVIETDKTISPSRALHKAANILRDHVDIISEIITKDEDVNKSSKKKEKDTKKTKDKVEKESEHKPKEKNKAKTSKK